ncbi:serine/threonine-protein kinase [Aquabacterium parvum]|uniref:serine/threonine-protein kinase n=1 Tax=Aquabacterium parvum TaxID=70584 RepID=UPI000718EA56|nr:serine/threonine-protein kinase [Aquabacterium parvum]
MSPVVGWILLLAVCVMGAGWWFTRRRNGGRGGDRSAGGARSTQWADFSDTSPLADSAAELQRRKRQALQDFVDSRDDNRPPSRFADTSPVAFHPRFQRSGPVPLSSAPEVVPIASMPAPTPPKAPAVTIQLPSDPGRPSGRPPLDSWFDDMTAPASITSPLNTLPGDVVSALGAEAAAADDPVADPNAERIHRALLTLGDGPVDQAWEALRGHLPPEGLKVATLETCDLIAAAFEAEQRFDAARNVYEHMADLDPYWRDVRQRLSRARGKAQVQAVESWGSVEARPAAHGGLSMLGKFVLDKQLGQGAMGAVYLAHDPATGQHVAIKTMALAREFTGDDLVDARSRFLREADMAGRLQHPDIVQILDAGETDGLAWIAMELIDGTDLGQHTQPNRLLPLPVVLRAIARVADALAYAHTRGVTHRDIKPENIMIDLPREGVKVMDFGVARLADASRTRTGVILGTPTYMSPEQLSGQHVDGRTDLYSLGVTLFQLLTGRLPCEADSLGALMRAIARETPPNVCELRPELPPALGDVVALALQKHPATRYSSGEQMAEDLRAVLKMLPDAGSPGVDISLA